MTSGTRHAGKASGTLTFNGAVIVSIEYDRDAMLRFMKRLAHAFVFEYNVEAMGTNVEIFPTITKDSIEDGRRVWGLMHVLEINKMHMSLDDFDKMISENAELRLTGEEEALPERLAGEFYERVNEALPNKIALVLNQLVDELYAWGSSKGGIVSRDEYDKVTRIPGFFIVPAKRGGSVARYAWTDGERSALQVSYHLLLTHLKHARRWYKSVCKNEPRNVAYSLVKAKFSKTFNISDGMIRRLCYLHTRDRDPYKWRPSDIAIEYAARLCNLSGLTYKPFSLTPRQLKGYLPKVQKGVR